MNTDALVARLPELPAPTKFMPDTGRHFVGYVFAYSKEQMREYAATAIEQQAQTIARMEKALRAICLSGAERDVRYAGMTARDIARAALDAQQSALDRMADNARELGLDYKPREVKL